MACQFNLVLYGPSAPARRISRSRWAGSRACARYRSGSSPRPGCSCGCAARNGGGLDAELRQIARARLPVIDEFGYMPIDEEGSRLLFQVISDSYETRSVIHATNIGISGWGRVLGDKNMAAALIDRTVRHGRLTGFEGGSYRSAHALMTR